MEGATNTVATVSTALTGALGTAGSDLLGVVSSILPVAIPVMIGIVAVTLGMKMFKRVTK